MGEIERCGDLDTWSAHDVFSAEIGVRKCHFAKRNNRRPVKKLIREIGTPNNGKQANAKK